MAKQKKIPTRVRQALEEKGVHLPQVAELVSHFMTAAGGPKAMAKMLMEEFLNAKQGSIVRQRILDSVLRMLNVANQGMPEVSETDLIEDDDLERALSDLIGKVGVGDGKEEGD